MPVSGSLLDDEHPRVCAILSPALAQNKVISRTTVAHRAQSEEVGGLLT